jgi:hypothetical protein
MHSTEKYQLSREGRMRGDDSQPRMMPIDADEIRPKGHGIARISIRLDFVWLTIGG